MIGVLLYNVLDTMISFVVVSENMLSDQSRTSICIQKRWVLIMVSAVACHCGEVMPDMSDTCGLSGHLCKTVSQSFFLSPSEHLLFFLANKLISFNPCHILESFTSL